MIQGATTQVARIAFSAISRIWKRGYEERTGMLRS
jgi:hypothetical protein